MKSDFEEGATCSEGIKVPKYKRLRAFFVNGVVFLSWNFRCQLLCSRN
jgi:hypothetical protein